MKNRNDAILEAATRRFFRYGVKKTSIGEIAEDAGFSRQTVYNAFADKDELLRATVSYLGEQLLVSTRAALAEADTLPERINAILDHQVVQLWDLVHNNPDAADLTEGVSEVAREEIGRNLEAVVQLIAEALTSEQAEIEAMGMTPLAFAETFLGAAYGVKNNATDRNDLMVKVEQLTTIFLRALR